MTEKGLAFIERFRLVRQVAESGQPMFVAFAIAMEPDDWFLIYAAVCKLVADIEVGEDPK